MLCLLTAGFFFACNDSTEPKKATVLNYDLIDDCYVVSGIVSLEDTDLVIPATYNGIPVTEIGYSAFSGNQRITSVTVSDGITKIGSYAFENCSALKTVILPTGITEFYENTFYGCESLTDFVIPDGITRIANNAFQYCSSLTSIEFPDSVRRVDERAFGNCSALEEIKIGSGMSRIDNNAFDLCVNISLISVDENNGRYSGAGNCILSKNGNTLIFGCKNSIIPETVTEIGYYSFYNCRQLTKIFIPENVRRISSGAFYNCFNLESIIIPAGVSTIRESAFSGCSKLSDIWCEAPEKPQDWHVNWNHGCLANVRFMNEWQYVNGQPTPIN